MTARNLYDYVLIELNKTNAPNILLEDFNYFANRAINLFVNKRYNIYDMNQQTTDDLRVLSSSTLLTPQKCERYGDLSEIGRIMGATYEVLLPLDYLHILNCICIYKVNKTYLCYDKGSIWRCPAKKLTSDMYSMVLDNYWNKPTYKNPYYILHNVNDPVDTIYLPTDPRRAFDGVEPTPEPTPEPLPLENLYYIGTTQPTENNYRSLLNRTSLSGAVEIGTTPEIYYVIFPKSVTVTLWNESSYLWEINTTVPQSLGSDFLYIKTVLKLSGGDPGDTFIGVYVKNSGGSSSSGSNSSYGSSTIEIGTDYKSEGMITTYNNPFESNSNYNLGTDAHGNLIYRVDDGSGVKNSIYIQTSNGLKQASFVERSALVRYGNASGVRLEIRYGSDNSVFQLSKVLIDYIKAPLHIRLTQEQIDLTEDYSQVLEYPDYVCQEILNELVNIIMENISDGRLQTHPVVSLSIANPAQQLTEPVAQQLPT